MRCTQIYGLNDWARKLVEGNTILLYRRRETRIYPDGRVETIPVQDVFGSDVRIETLEEGFEGMFGKKYPLHRYTFPDGCVLVESVQAEPWSSGPCVYLALEDESGAWVPESLWPEDAMV